MLYTHSGVSYTQYTLVYVAQFHIHTYTHIYIQHDLTPSVLHDFSVTVKKFRPPRVTCASENPDNACLLLDQSSPEVIQRASQAEQELAVYQQQQGIFIHTCISVC